MWTVIQCLLIKLIIVLVYFHVTVLFGETKLYIKCLLFKMMSTCIISEELEEHQMSLRYHVGFFLNLKQEDPLKFFYIIQGGFRTQSKEVINMDLSIHFSPFPEWGCSVTTCLLLCSHSLIPMRELISRKY